MDKDERQKKLEASRAKFAHFRQRKAKSDGLNPPKKTPKRKGTALHSHDLPAQECPLAAGQDGGDREGEVEKKAQRPQSKPTETDGEFSSSSTLGDSNTEELTLSLAELARLEVQECGGQITAMEERLLGKQTALDQLTVEGERLQEKLGVQSGTEQLQELETAVQNRNDIISQLTTNLQHAIENRDEVQREALQLTNQIQALQLQLQQASELLRTKSPGSMELAQAQQQMQVFQMSLKDQSLHLETLEQKAQELEQQLEDSRENAKDKENLLIHMTDKLENTEVQLNKIIDEKEELTLTISQLHHTLSVRDKEALELKNEMVALTANQQQHSVQFQHPGTELCYNEELSRKLEEQMEEFQRERSEMEDRLKHLQEDLNRAEYQAREAMQYKTEKEKLNEDISKLNAIIEELNGKLTDEEEASKHWRAKYQVDISNYNMQLQTLEQEKAEVLSKHDEEIRLLRQQLESQHDDRVVCYKQGIENLKENLNKIKARKDQVNHEATDESQGEEFTLELSGHAEEGNILMDKYLASSVHQESSWAEGSLEDHSSNEHSDHYRFELDSEILEQKMSGSTKDDLERSADLTGQSFPDGDAVELGLEPEEEALQWQKYTIAMHKLDESADAIDVEKAFVIQRCSELSEQLNEKKKELDVLQTEVMRSSKDMQEVQDKCKKVTEELFVVRSELEAEKLERANCEELIKLKSQMEEDLRNKLRIFEKQNEKDSADRAVAEIKNTSDTGAMECLIKELTQEKEFLLTQLQEQEQLVKDVQKQKLAGDSVTSEVQTLFGRQLAALQAQRDQLQMQLEAQKAKNQTTSELLGQKTLLEDSLCKELHLLKTECCEREALLKNLAEEKADLESKLLCIKQNLLNADEALNQNYRDKTLLEQNVLELDIKVKNLENVLESERQDLGNQLKSKSLDLQKIEVEFKNAEVEYLQKESALKTEVAELKKSIADLVRTHNEAVESLRLKEAEKLDHAVRAAQEELCSCYEEEKSKLKEQHQSEIKELNEEVEKKVTDLRTRLEEEQKKQIVLIKQVHERDFDREIAVLIDKHKEEMKHLRAELTSRQQELLNDLRERMDEAHQAELHQTQIEKNLELEALRLSLTNLNAAQLELSQSNLQREKEAALSELQENLNDKRAQEIAMLQTRQQFELERIKEQRRAETEQLTHKHLQEMDEVKQDWMLKVAEMKAQMDKKHSQKIEALLQEWEDNAEKSLGDLQQKLSEKQAELEELQGTQEVERERLLAELSCLQADKELAASMLKDLEELHRTSMVDLKERLHQEYDHSVQELRAKTEGKERELHKEIEKLQTMYDDLKAHSEQEIEHLWSQLENSRTSRQELGELKEQLLARTSRIDDIEQLKQEFAQQRLELRAQNEIELEHLRTYFEQKLCESGDRHKEEISHLQQCLEEGVLETADTSSLPEEKRNEEQTDLLGELTQQLEQHKKELESLRVQFEERHRNELKALRSSLSLQHKEELLQVKTHLADRYFSEMQELRTKHSLELEQLRAKLSDNHIKEITKLRLQSAQEAARQVEEEVINRVRSLEEEHHAKLSLMKSEQEHIQQLEERIEQLKKEHAENMKSITAQHKELQKQSIEQAKLNFLEDLKLKLDEAKMEEAEKVAKAFSEKAAQELTLLRVQLQSLSEEKLSALREELTSLAEEERQALTEEFRARELEMKRLQASQEVMITELEKELKEERNQLQVLQDSLENEQSPQITLLRQKIQAQCDSELATAKATMAEELKQLNINLQEQSEAKLQEAQSRFTKEKEEITEKLTLQQETLLNELKERHVEELEAQNRQLQEQHQKQLSELQQRLQANTETLEQGLKEEHRAQMEALEAELQTKHKTEMEELEARLLSNMDTLETTYLSEIQSIRDEHSQAVQDLKSSFDLTLCKHREDLQREKQEAEATLAQELERLKGEHETELKSSAEELRKELAAVYMEKFKAMAAELEEAHKVELEAALQSQRDVLEAEQGKALDVLGAEVLRLEDQHQRAMQELQELHTTEVHRQQDEYSRQLQQESDKLKALYQEQQRECSSASASEMEAVQEQLAAQFEEERSRQYRQFQEEIELLKCQSEVLLEQQITQLKEEFEAEKKAALEKQDVEFAEKHELSDKNHRELKDQLTAQIREQAAVLTQLKEEVSVLQKEMEEKDSELETLLQRRERENEEGGNLVTMLRSDLSRNTEEQKSLQEAHERVLKLLLEVAKSTIATEDVISQRIGICMDSSQMLGGENLSVLGAAGQPHRKNPEGQEKGDLHSPASEAATETSLWSALTDEGFELSQRLSESIFTGPELEAETEQMILGVCERLRSAVEKLLDLVTESTRQLEQTHGIHVHLEEQFSRQNKETARFVNQHQNLIEQLDEETKTKKQLELELHKAEGLIEGYVAEKAALEEALQRKEKSEQCLVLELETLRGQLHELSEEHSLLVRQREAITANMGDRETGLLAEADLLAKEKLDLQCQAEKDRSNLTSRLKLLETELEEQISHNLELEQKHRLELADLQQQILALEKQLRNDRHFIDEQAVEREHERDEFQIEIKKLEAQLRNPMKCNTGGDYKEQKIDDLVYQVETLQATIKEKMDDYNTLLLAKEQYVRDINEQNEEIEKMASRICELEEAALGNAEAAKKVSQLEQELQQMKKMEQDYLQDKEALQQQQYSNRLQISALQSKLDETRHRFPENSSDQVLKEQLEAEREALLNKEKEVEILADQLDQFQKDLVNKSEEVLQLNMQLEIQMKQSAASIEKVQEESKQLKEKVASLHKQLGVDSDESRTSMLQFPQALMEEKNQEIDHLNEQIFRLQQELKNNTDNKVYWVLEEKNVEIEDLRSQIEHLHGDQERLRRDKDEEVEQLHEVIEKLQEELAQLGPNRHEVSDSQDSPESPLHSLERELWQHPSQEDSLQRELASEHLQSSKARLRELEGQLDLACTEKEYFRSEVEKLGKDLHNECRQLSILQEESVLLRASLSQREAKVGMLSTQARELEDILREREAQLLETETEVKTLEEQIVAKGAGLEAELSKKQEECEELQSLKSLLDSQLQDLKQAEVKNQGDIEKLQAEVAKLEACMKDSQVEILTLSSEKTELFSECQALQLNVERLQGEVERLKVEVAEKNTLVQELSAQLEDKSARNAAAQKEVLSCAEETLAKAEAALKEKEEALSDLQALLSQLRAELSAVKEDLSSSTEKTERLLEEGQEKDRSLADLESHNGSLKLELRKLQEDFTKQEEELSHQKNEVEVLRAQYGFQAHETCKEQSNTIKPEERSSQTGPGKPHGFLYNFSNESSLCSPELVRKYDASMEHTYGFNSTHLSELNTLHSTGQTLLHSKSPGLDRDCSEPSDHLTCDSEEHSSHSTEASPPFSEGTYSVLDSIDTEKAKALENLDLTPSASPVYTESTLSVHECVSDGYASNASSDLGAKLKLELETTERLDANFVEYLRQRGMSLADNPDRPAEFSLGSEDMLSNELQSLLKKVYEEGCRVLALSEQARPVFLPDTRPLPSTLSDSWLKEKQALQETIQSLKELLSKMVDKGDEEAANGDSDWRRELLQAVRSVFDGERDWLRAELQSHLCSQGSGAMSILTERLESIVKEQDEQQRVALEQLLSADRSSLLSEIQSLQAQQRISHLQSQEQLQQLQASLTTAEEQASKREHQLRRQVELLEYKLQQEQAIVNDLQNSLRAEQARSTKQRSHLKSEQDAVTDLKQELSDTNQELERSLKAQQELQKEIRKLRANLESQEADLCSAVESLEKEQQRVKEIQDILDQERLKNILRNDQEGQTHELLQTSLEDRNIQNSQLCSALEQERIANSNLRKELQIEQSRCEALLSQERSKLGEVQLLLEIEKGRTTELSDGLAREQQRLAQEYKQRLEEEALRREGVATQEHNFIQQLQAQLDQERERTVELAAMMEKTQQQAIQAKRQLEAGVQQSREEAQREHDTAAKLRTVLETLQTQKQELERSLETERQQGTRLRTDIEQLQGKIQSVKQKERSREEQREVQRRQDRQALSEKDRRHERDSEKLHEMELQHQRDQLRIKQLQQTLAELEEQERDLSSRKHQQTGVLGTGHSCSFPQSPDRKSFFLHQQHLQFTRQQLQLATLRLKDLVHSSSARTVDGRSYTEDEDMKLLLKTLTGLDNDLLNLCSSTQRPVQTSSIISERLLKENADLTTCMGALTEEKIDLKRTIAKLEKELLIHKQRGAGSEQVRSHEMVDSVQASERAVWQKERAFLHSALKKAESELSRVTAEIENRPLAADVSHAKINRLYGRYMRAESFRKALVYQKKYLLLLLGGFQDCEQATLSLIARMGVYPSAADLQNSAPRSLPINKFRSAVRVVIAISRLRFLVKKWQKATKKGPIQVVAVNGSTHSEGPGFRTEVLRQHPGVTFNSPPTRETEILHRSAIAHLHQPPKSPYRLHNRSYHSPGPSRSFTSQDSLTDYIHHLEVVQQQLGGLSSGPSPGPPYSRISKR
ncbi:pericentrin-like isoform X2 [Acipenser ruthenus]|uniref:pericentrin-like isoform X2 n=1 Tax=Acipenser ruthenus TaxID=7906 RepID=UPI002741D61A|nr:pericentrin-like isoform X2 [Acipenser ruthenus]